MLMFGRLFPDLPDGHSACCVFDVHDDVNCCSLERSVTSLIHKYVEPSMQIDLSDAEWDTLRLVLRDYLPQLRREVARTEVLAFRHEMVKRQEVCEHLLDLLEEAKA